MRHVTTKLEVTFSTGARDVFEMVEPLQVDLDDHSVTVLVPNGDVHWYPATAVRKVQFNEPQEAR